MSFKYKETLVGKIANAVDKTNSFTKRNKNCFFHESI